MPSMNRSEQVVTESAHRVLTIIKDTLLCTGSSTLLVRDYIKIIQNTINSTLDNLVPRVHRNTRRLPKNTLSHEDIMRTEYLGTVALIWQLLT